tara:strand:- start:53 stop:460 length:408 start_codon:yes stop_codon:yes gene_type:complete
MSKFKRMTEMKKLALTTALLVGVSAPVFAGTFDASGYVNGTAARISADIAGQSDDGNDRLFAKSGTVLPSTAGHSAPASRGAVNSSAAEIFANLNAASDDGNDRLFVGNTGTVAGNGIINARAAAIFDQLENDAD